MKPISIPVRGLMHDPTDAVEYMPMPREMTTFEMPRVPDPGPDTDIAGARDVLQVFLDHMSRWLSTGGELPALDLAGLEPAALRVLNETLGEGEVSAIVAGRPRDPRAGNGVLRRLAPAALARHAPAARLPAGRAHPAHRADPGREGASPRLRALPLPAGAMNVPALVHELQEAMDRAGPDTPARVINLTLLPLSPEDVAHLDAVLDGGTVTVLSRGFGNCRISSTAARHVWRVQYFNNMQTLILNTLEITTMPEVAMAAREDLLETRDRLADLVVWMGDSITTA
jgi:hydrogenase-1 operon protein HyaF